jgi:hypothetical protein
MTDLMGRGPLGLKGKKTPKAPRKRMKAGGPKMTKLRRAAKGQTCTLRLDCCNHNPETTSLCHIRAFGWAGTAEKPHDFLAVFACSDCHDALDRRRNGELWGWDDLLRAFGETLIAQHRMGNIIIA